jgi:hypothetical protein
MSTGSRFRNKEQMKQNLGSLFARSEDDDADVGNAGESLSCITTTSVAEKSTLRKSLNFASEVSQGDINITNRSGRAPESAGGVGCWMHIF